MLDDKLRVGVYGGTFAPVHNGHVESAVAFMRQMKLDYLYVIPTCLPPHKTVDFADSPEARLRMCELAFSGIDGIVVSDMEIRRGGVSYTADTVRALKEMHPDGELYLFFGDDWLEGFPRWYNFDYLRENLTVALANRSGRDVTRLTEKLRTEHGVKIFPLQFEAIIASSTAFRGGDTSLCTDEVNRYIAEKGLYR